MILKSKPYVSIDIETTGLNPDNCQILEIGAIIDDWETPVEKLSTFHCYVAHSLYHGEPYALQLNQETLLKLSNRESLKDQHTFLDPGDVATEFAAFLDANGMDRKQVQAAGKNFGSFDKQFLERLGNWNDLIKLAYRSYDPAMLFWNPEEDESPPNLKTCMERAGIVGDVAHTALEDAAIVVQLMRVGAGKMAK